MYYCSLWASDGSAAAFSDHRSQLWPVLPPDSQQQQQGQEHISSDTNNNTTPASPSRTSRWCSPGPREHPRGRWLWPTDWGRGAPAWSWGPEEAERRLASKRYWRPDCIFMESLTPSLNVMISRCLVTEKSWWNTQHILGKTEKYLRLHIYNFHRLEL